MSHDATNWAIKQRGLKPTTKIWTCTGFVPDYGCFPSQVRLAHDCEISRSTLNDHPRQLEAGGLLRRVPRIDPVCQSASNPDPLSTSNSDPPGAELARGGAISCVCCQSGGCSHRATSPSGQTLPVGKA